MNEIHIVTESVVFLLNEQTLKDLHKIDAGLEPFAVASYNILDTAIDREHTQRDITVEINQIFDIAVIFSILKTKSRFVFSEKTPDLLTSIFEKSVDYILAEHKKLVHQTYLAKYSIEWMKETLEKRFQTEMHNGNAALNN